MGYQTASGSVVSFNSDFRARVKNLRLNIEPVQSGSGDPNPDIFSSTSGSIVSFETPEARQLKKLKINVDPVQDLHGYDNPWPAGGGSNKFPIIATQTLNDVALTNNNGVITLNGTASDITRFDAPLGATIAEGTTIRLSLFNADVISGVAVYVGNDDFTSTFQLNPHTANATLSSTINFTATKVRIRVSSGTQITNKVIKPMLTIDSAVPTSFAPYSNICPISGWTEANVWRTGANIWDEEWEAGTINPDTGANRNSDYNIRAKNKISVLPNTTYFIVAPEYVAAYYYGSDEGYLGRESIGRDNTFTTPATAYYMRFSIGSSSIPVTTYNHNIAINYPSTDHDYHPYTGTTYPITIPTPPGTVYGGYIHVAEDGSAELVVTMVSAVMASLNWVYQSSEAYFGVNPGGMLSAASINMLCESYKPMGRGSAATLSNAASGTIYHYNGQLRLKNTAYTTKEALVESLGTQIVVYELETPITYPLSDIDITTLLGTNVMWADSGDINVTYLSQLANIRPISGWSTVNLYRESAYDPTATPYIPITIPTPPGTAYGGYIHTLEDGSAELVVTDKMIRLADYEWMYQSASYHYIFTTAAFDDAVNNDTTESRKEGLCSDYKVSVGTSINASMTPYSFLRPNRRLVIRNDDYTDDLDGFANSLGDATFVYKLAEPLVYPLSPINLLTLIGQNNIWCDSGDISLDYLVGVDSKPIVLRQTDTKTGAIVSTKDAYPKLPRSMRINIDPVQDLHGYDNPWPAGGGKNLYPNCDISYSGTDFTVVHNADESYTINGTASANRNVTSTDTFTLKAGTYRIDYFSSATTTIRPQLRSPDGSITYKNGTGSFTLEADTEIRARLYIASGTASSNLIYRIMIVAGTTTPTAWSPYSNICPISGWTEANVWRTGKNLFDISRLDVTGVSVTGNTATATANIFSARFLNGGILPYGTKIDQKVTLTVTAKCNTENQESSIGLIIGFIFLDGSKTTNLSARIPNSQLDWETYTVTIQGSPEKPVVDLFISYSTKGTYEWTVKDIQLELDSTATPYEPYSGTTYPITIPTPPGTAYGGYIHVNADGSAELVVDRAMVDLGTLEWNVQSDHVFRTSKSNIGCKEVNTAVLVCSEYPVVTASIDKGMYQTTAQIRVTDSAYTDKDVFTTAMSGVQLVYELDTPITYPLSDIEVQLLKGPNTLWADCGDTTLTYDRLSMLFIS